MRTCIKCKNPNNDNDAEFCTNCGFPLDSNYAQTIIVIAITENLCLCLKMHAIVIVAVQNHNILQMD